MGKKVVASTPVTGVADATRTDSDDVARVAVVVRVTLATSKVGLC